ncbi:MAG: hypothetical protein EXS01_02835 [Phycisphaerales bacterium]|nr:hypothetical protein [Phycisphaerales bacterium]
MQTNCKSSTSITAVILAAGKGTRMNSDLPKVMHPAFGKPLVEWVVDSAITAGATRIILVVGHREEVVRAHFAQHPAHIEFVTQRPQLGTGHAVDQARPLIQGDAPQRPLLVLCGDGPLITPATIATILSQHAAANAAATLATSVIPDAQGYGRIARDPSGAFQAIVEQKDCSAEQLMIREINPSYYCFATGALLSTLGQVGNRNASGEYYITDVFGILKQAGHTVQVVDAVPPEEVLSVNTEAQLAEVSAILQSRKTRRTPTCSSQTTETRR